MTYKAVIQVADTSSPPKTDQLPYNLTVRPEFTLSLSQTQGNASVMPDAVQGRTYGVAPLTEILQTTLQGNADSSPVGHVGESGNGPMTATSCSPTAGTFTLFTPNSGLITMTNQAAAGQCPITSVGSGPITGGPAAGTPPQNFTVTVKVSDNPINVLNANGILVTAVPANTITGTYTLTVDPPISFSANFDNYSPTPPPGGAATPPVGTGPASAVPDAVQTRTYGAVGAYGTAAAGGKTSLIFSAQGGLLNTQGLTFTPPASSSTPAISGVPAPVQCGPAAGTTYPQKAALGATATLVCNSGGAAGLVTAAAGLYSFNVAVTDAGNATTPPPTPTSTDALGHPTHTLTADAPLVLSLAQAGNSTATNPANLLDAVSGRTYGVVGGTPTYTPTGGLGANGGTLGNDYYQWCVTTSGGLPATFDNANGNNLNLTCPTTKQATIATLESLLPTQSVTTATPYSFTVQLNDTGNATTPNATLTNSSILTVHPPLVASLTQAGATNPSALLPGVVNRSYGFGSLSGGAPTYAAAGGLMVGSKPTYLWCVSTGPNSLPANLVGISANCGLGASTGSNSVQLSASATNPIGAAGSFRFTVQADDGGNPAVPSTFALPSADSKVTTVIQINPQIALAQSLGAVWPDAVSGRSYGTAPGCFNGTTTVACAPAIYTASNGLGGYVWPGTTSSFSGINGMTCPAVATGSATYTCSSTTGVITAAPTTAGSPSQSYSPSVTVTDTPNAATPAATTATDPRSTRTDTLTVDAPLQETLTQATVPGSNPAGLLAGVMNRSYGMAGTPPTIGAPPTYAAAGGLGANPVATGGLGPNAYQWCVAANSPQLPPAGLGPGGATVSANCPTHISTGALLALTANPITGAAKSYSFTMQLDDTGNLATPGSASRQRLFLRGADHHGGISSLGGPTESGGQSQSHELIAGSL